MENNENGLSYESLKHIADHIKARINSSPKIGIICGTCLGCVASILEDVEILPYDSIPHFPTPTVTGHAGKLVFGTIDGVSVACLQGRWHFYEGHPLWKCAMPVRVLKLLGVDNLIVSNAAGGLDPEFKVGDLMVIKDHINFHGFGGVTPLRGENDDNFGPRFVSLSSAYDKKLRLKVRELSREGVLSGRVHEGVYVMMSGPAFETPAELKALRTLGVDAVGMSTIPEVIIARHCNVRVFGFSLITNKCIMDCDLGEELVVECDPTEDTQKRITYLVTEIVKEMAKE